MTTEANMFSTSSVTSLNEHSLLARMLSVIDSFQFEIPRQVEFFWLVLEQAQLYALIFNSHFQWGPILSGISIPVYFTIFPFWDQTYDVHISYTGNTAFLWIVFAATFLLAAIVSHRIHTVGDLKLKNEHVLVRWFVMLLLTVFYLPCMNLLFAMCMCDDGYGVVNVDEERMTDFSDVKCFGGSPYWYIIFVVSIVTMAPLAIARYVKVVGVFSDDVFSKAALTRSHSSVELILHLHEMLFILLYHYLPAIGQQQTFAGLFAAGNLLCVVLHVVMLPFFDHATNQLRVVSMSILMYVALIKTIILQLPNSIVADKSTNWDAAIIFVGGGIVGVLSFLVSSIRVSRQCLFDMKRAQHGDMSKRSLRSSAFPLYLPAHERRTLDGVLQSPEEDGQFLQASLGNKTNMTSSNMMTSANRMLASQSGNYTDTVGADYTVNDTTPFVLAPYLSAIHFASDVEVSTRFVPLYHRLTGFLPPTEMYIFAIRIYSKGMSRFHRDVWLRLQFAGFICASGKFNTRFAMELLDSVNHSDVSVYLNYRIFRRLTAANSLAYMRETTIATLFEEAQKHHNNALVNIRNFWTRLLLNQSNATQMSALAKTITQCCDNGLYAYQQLLAQKPRPHVVTRYAQFLDYVLMDSENATATREAIVETLADDQASYAYENYNTTTTTERKMNANASNVIVQLRWQLWVVFFLIVAVLVAMIVVVAVFGTEQTRMHDIILLAGESQTLTYRLRWWLEFVKVHGLSDDDPQWTNVQRDVTSFRNAVSKLTYGSAKKSDSAVVEFQTQPRFSMWFYPTNEFFFDALGFWVVSEKRISAFETLISTGNTAGQDLDLLRTMSVDFVMQSCLSTNISVSSYTEAAQAFFDRVQYAIVGLFLGVLFLLSVAFAIISFNLSKITLSKLSVLELFTLIPKNALQDLVDKCEETLDNFDKPDEKLEQMCQDAGLLDVLSDSSMDSLAISLRDGSMRESDRSAMLEDDTVNEVGTSFASVIRNTTVADTGKVRFNPELYEMPYAKSAFVAPKPTFDEKRELQRRIDDIEIKENLEVIQKIARQRDEAIGIATGAQRRARNGKKNRKINDKRLIYILLSLGTCICLVIGSLQLRYHAITSSPSPKSDEVYSNIMDAHYAQLQEQEITQGMVYAPSNLQLKKYIRIREYQSFAGLSQKLMEGIDGAGEALPQLFWSAAWYEPFQHYNDVAVTLACLSADDVDCSVLDAIYWTANSFAPPPNVIIPQFVVTEMPTDRATDIATHDKAGLLKLAKNCIESTYYSYISEQLVHSRHNLMGLTHKLLQSQLGAKEQEAARLKQTSVALSGVLFLLLLFTLFTTSRTLTHHFYLRATLFLCLAVSIALLIVSAVMLRTRLSEGVVDEDVYALIVAENRTRGYSQYIYENSILGAFRGSQVGVVSISEIGGVDEMEIGWTSLINILGTKYFDVSRSAFTYIRQIAEIDLIVARIACTYHSFPVTPYFETVAWNIDTETIVTELQEVLHSQQFYTNTADDLAGTPEYQYSLMQALSFGEYRATLMNKAAGLLLEISTAIQKVNADQYKADEKTLVNLSLAACALAFVCALVCVVIIARFAWHSDHVVDTAQENESRVVDVRDGLFHNLISRAVMALCATALLAAVAFITFTALMQVNRNASVAQETALQRETQTLMSATLYQISSSSAPWYLNKSIAYAADAVESSRKFYVTPNMIPMSAETLTYTIGPMKPSAAVRAAVYSNNSATDAFVKESQVVIGTVDLSMRQWSRRVSEGTVMTETSNGVQAHSLSPDVLELIDSVHTSSRMYTEDVKKSIHTTVIAVVVVISATILLFLVLVLFVFSPMLGMLMREEAGTKVMLRLIPSNVRDSVPAIAEYLETGVVRRDTKLYEIDEEAADASITPTITIDAHGTILKFSRAAEEALLWTKSEAIGQNVKVIVPDNIAVHHDEFLLRYMQTGKRNIIDKKNNVHAKRKDGTTYPVELVVREVRRGRQTNFIGTLRNREEEIEFERAVGLSKALSEASTVPFVVINGKGVIQQFSFAACLTFNCSSRDVIGRKVNILMSQSDSDVHDKYLERYHQTGKKRIVGSSRYVKAKKLNGELFPVRLSVQELKRADESLFIGYIEDMTEQLNLEMAALASESAMTKSPVALILTDDIGTITYWSHSAEKTFGYPAVDVLKRSINILMTDYVANRHAASMQNYLRNEQKRGTEVRLSADAKRRETDGTYSLFPCRVTARSIYSTTKGYMFAAFIEDISSSCNLETKRRIAESVFSMSSTPIVRIGPTGQIVALNDSAAAMFGYTLQDALGLVIEDLLEESKAPKASLRAIVREFMDSGGKTKLQASLRTHGRNRNKDVFPVDVQVLSVTHDNQVAFILFIRSTLNDLKLIEANVQNEAMLNLSLTAVVGTSIDGSILFVSASTCTTFDWTKEELVGENITILISEEQNAAYASALANYKSRFKLHGAEDARKNSPALFRESRIAVVTRSGYTFLAGVQTRDIQVEGWDSLLVTYFRDLSSEIGLTTEMNISKSILELSTDPIIGITGTGIVTMFSPAAEKVFGYSATEIIGKNVKVLIPDDIAVQHDGFLRAYAKTKEKHIIDRRRELRAKRKNGSEFPMELMVKEVSLNETNAFIGFVRDLSEKYARIQAITVNEVVEELVAVPLAIAELTGVVVRCNRFFKEEFGYDQTAMAGKSLSLVVPTDIPGQEAWLRTVVEDLHANRRDSSIENSGDTRVAHTTKRFMARRMDGTQFICELSLGEATVHKLRGKKLVVYFRNVEMELRLQIENEINSAMVYLSPIPIVCMEETGEVLVFSRAAEETFGYSSAEVVGRNVKMLMPAETAAKHDGYLRRYLDTGISSFVSKGSRRVHGRRKDGTTFALELSVKGTKNANNRSVFIGYLRDFVADVANASETAFSECVIEYSPLCMICTDWEGKIENFSKEAQELLLYDRDDVIGRNVSMIKARILTAEDIQQAESESTAAATAAHPSSPSTISLRAERMRTGGGNISLLGGMDGGRGGLSGEKSNTSVGGKSRLSINPFDSDAAASLGEGYDFFAVNMKMYDAHTPYVHEKILVRRADRTFISCSVIVREVMANNTSSSRFIAYIEPMEDIARIEKRLMRANALLEGVPSPVLLISVRGIIVDINQAATTVFGYSENELKDHRIQDLMPAAVASQQMTYMMREVTKLVDHNRRNQRDDSLRATVKAVMINRKGEESLKQLSFGEVRVPTLTEPFFAVYVDDIQKESQVEYVQQRITLTEAQSAIATIRTDTSGKITHLSKTAEELLGYTSAEANGRLITLMVMLDKINSKPAATLSPVTRSPTGNPSIQSPFEDFAHTPNVMTHKFLFVRHKNGKLIASDCTQIQILNANSSLHGYAYLLQMYGKGFYEDNGGQYITGTSVMDFSTKPMMIINSEGLIERANQAAITLFKVPQSACLVGRNVSVVLPRHHRLFLLSPSTSTLPVAMPAAMAATKEIPDKKSHNCVQIEGVEYEGGKTFAIELTTHEVKDKTEKKTLAYMKRLDSEQQISLTRKINKAILEMTPGATIVVNENGKVLLCSPSASTLFDFSAEDIVGLPIAELFYGNDVPELLLQIKNTVSRNSDASIPNPVSTQGRNLRKFSRFPCELFLCEVKLPRLTSESLYVGYITPK